MSERDEECKFELSGLCYAKACYTATQCKAKDENGNPKYAVPKYSEVNVTELFLNLAAKEEELTKAKAEAGVMREALEKVVHLETHYEKGMFSPFTSTCGVLSKTGKVAENALSTTGQDMLDRMKAKDERIAELEEVLRFYADDENHYNCSVIEDYGEKARAVLGGDTSCTTSQE